MILMYVVFPGKTILHINGSYRNAKRDWSTMTKHYIMAMLFKQVAAACLLSKAVL